MCTIMYYLHSKCEEINRSVSTLSNSTKDVYCTRNNSLKRHDIVLGNNRNESD